MDPAELPMTQVIAGLLSLVVLNGQAYEYYWPDEADALPSLLPPLPSGAHVALLSAPADGDQRTGGRVWHCAPVLCRWMREAAAALSGAAVLELGSGTGACGLYAAGAFASRVVLTDGDERLRALQV